MKTNVKTADEIIILIAETLTEADGKFIEGIANQVLTEKVTYCEDSLFQVDETT